MAPTRSKRPLEREVHALEHRRLQLEERQRLSGHVLDPVHEDLHGRGGHAHADALLVAAVHELDRLLLGEVGVRDQHLVDRVEMALELLERAEVAEAVEEPHRRACHEAVGLDLAAVLERVGDGLDVRAGPDEHGPAPVAGRAENRAARGLEDPSERGHVDQREEEGCVEDVVRLEFLALEQRVEQHDQGRLEEGRDHAREAGALGARPVEAGAPEQQQHHEAAERQVVHRLVPHQADGVGMPDGRLHEQSGVDREEQAGDVERGERHDAYRRASQVEAEQPPEHGLTRPDVALGQRERLYLLQFFEKSVGHGMLCVGT